jgi:haloacetate dehalogenase
MFAGFQHHVVDVNGMAISCVVGGSGPPLLLLHGFPQSKAMWAKVAERLAAHYTVICADLRGYGDSAKPQSAADHSTYAFRTLAADQVGLMERLGFADFFLVGHDRGGRVAHRLALDHPARVRALAVLDIVPTLAMFMETNRHVAGAYWHWYFLSQPAPFPETLIGHDPDFFFETCLVGWGAAALGDFDASMLAEYRRCWRDSAMIHAVCADYRAAATVDLEHDAADADRKVACPTLALYGEWGLMAKLFDIPAEWRRRCVDLRSATAPGGHFFIDQFPDVTGDALLAFLAEVQRPL